MRFKKIERRDVDAQFETGRYLKILPLSDFIFDFKISLHI